MINQNQLLDAIFSDERRQNAKDDVLILTLTSSFKDGNEMHQVHARDDDLRHR